jgi:anti-sigma-K factor RskA
MTINEIRDSGLLELYVLGALSGSELAQVEAALIQYPELKADINNIERTLQSYATAHAIQPNPLLKNKILEEARKTPSDPNLSNSQAGNTTTKNPPPTGNSGFNFLKGLLAILSMLCVFLAYNWFNSNQEKQQLENRNQRDLEVCDSIREASTKQYALYQDLTNPNNKIISNAPIPKYPETEIYFYHNPVDKKNYLQLSSLPPIDNNTQSYQLWSIKGTDPPRPLDVFQSDGDKVIPVQHIDGTQVYAITIERKGGVQSPTLDDLIGTFAI